MLCTATTKVFEGWQANRVGRGAPVFIVVCNNTSTSKLVYDHIAGYEREESGRTVLIDGKLPLFRNVEEDGAGGTARERS